MKLTEIKDTSFKLDEIEVELWHFGEDHEKAVKLCLLLQKSPEMLDALKELTEIQGLHGWDSSNRRILRVEPEVWNKIESLIKEL